MTPLPYTLQRTINRRRERRWARRKAAAKWLVLLVLLVVGTMHACRAGDGTTTAATSLPWWVVPVIMVGILIVLALILWSALVGIEDMQTDGDPAATDLRADHSDLNTDAWIRELRAFFRHRWVLVTDEQCREMSALCAPDHPAAISMLDDYLRRRMGLTLFVSTLLSIQEICLKREVKP